MRRIATNKSKKGFTLTELAIAIVFISILLLTIAVVTLNMVRIYHKGSTMKSINTVGLDLISEFTDAISDSGSFDYRTYCETLSDEDVCINNKGQKFIFQEKTADVIVEDGGVVHDAQLYGIFCSGKYSYFWNTGYTMGDEGKGSDLYRLLSDATVKPAGSSLNSKAKLTKYYDPSRQLCKTVVDGTYSSMDIDNANPPAILSELSDSELINTDDLAIFSLKINPPIIEDVSYGALYSASLILGSISGGIIIGDDNPQCSMDTDSTYDIEYCATNKFNFTMKANGSNNV